MNGNLNIFLYALEFDFSFRFIGLRYAAYCNLKLGC